MVKVNRGRSSICPLQNGAKSGRGKWWCEAIFRKIFGVEMLDFVRRRLLCSWTAGGGSFWPRVLSAAFSALARKFAGSPTSWGGSASDGQFYGDWPLAASSTQDLRGAVAAT